MAEFKLGRIRFVWKGDWATSTTYYKDDVVAVGGRMYICTIGHSSSPDFFTDFDIVPPKWNLVSDGLNWSGTWQTGTAYSYNDVVEYGGRLYICNTVHTSADDSTQGLEADSANWTIFSEGLAWKGDWTPATRYIENDLVKYGGQTFVCNTYHTSAATEALGLEQDIGNWDYFNRGLEYKSSWTPDTKWKINDVVNYGAVLWICTTDHSGTTSFAADSSNWEQFVRGFQFENDWSPNITYNVGDVVRYGGNQYIAKTNHIAQNPFSQTDDWDIFLEGLRWKGEWGDDSANQDYRAGDLISHSGYNYICIADNSNQEPPNATYWNVFSYGIKWRGEWLDDQKYYAGDAVRYGSNSYICIQGHISEGDDFSTETPTDPGGGAQNSRPDLDVNQTYWNILSIGSEQSVLTTTGDMVYYSGSGPARLPVGENGQVLTVNSDSIPEWAYLGAADDVYYVAEHGVDSPFPEYGRTLDRPFASIRYAAKQVEQGAKNPNARRLLEANRRFIQREIVEWIEYQIDNAGVGSIWENFDYDTKKCERDMGLIVDAAVWDITHGGNVRSREAALSYINDTTGSPYLTQKAQTTAAINYGLTVIQAVLNQTAPTTNYQVTNGDNSTAIVTQDVTGTASESGVYTEIAGLVGIITDAITAGNDDDLPVRLERTTLIKVSTGKYYEMLPIIVPALCCVMGDELRATNVQPRKESNTTLTPKTDAIYSIQSFNRLEEIIGDIVRGVSVTPTTGNTTTQSAEFPFGEADQEAAVKQLARVIKNNANFGISEKNNVTFPGVDTIHDANYAYARDLIIANKDFIKEEVTGYIADQYQSDPTSASYLYYSKTKCKQDVGYIIDAICYDLSYQGNWQSVNAGLAYFNGNSGTLQIAGSEKTATLAAYAFLSNLLQTISRNITVTPLYNTKGLTQTNGEAGSAAAATTISNLMTNITDIINLGPGSAPTITYPDLSGVSIPLQTAGDACLNALPNIQEQTIDFISKNFGSFKYNSAQCRRDLRLIMNDISYGAALGSNFNSVQNGIAYTRAYASTVLADQLVETTGALAEAKRLVNISVTTDGSSATGSSTFATRTDAAFDEIIDILENGVAAADAITYPDHAGVVQNRKDAKDNLVANRQFLIDETVGWINAQIAGAAGIWAGFTYNQDKCARDLGYIVDGLAYDIMYQGTLATTRIAQSYFDDDGNIQIAGQEAQHVAMFTQLASVIEDVVQETTVTPTYSATAQTKPGTPATGTEATELTAKVTIVSNVINAGNLTGLPSIVYPDISSETAELQDAVSNLQSDAEDIIPDVIQYINTTYNDFNYDHDKCQRDLRIILDAARYDWMLGSTFASTVAAWSYLRRPSAKVVGNQKEATIAANEFARVQLISAITSANNNSTAKDGLNATWKLVQDTVFGGSNEGGTRQVEDVNSYNAILQLERNKEFIVDELLAYVDNYFKTTVTDQNGTTDVFTATSTAWMKQNMPIKFVNPDDSSASVSDAGLSTSTTYYVRDILTPTTFTISTTIGGSKLDVEDHEHTMIVQKAYEYNRTLCARDVREYVDAMKWDLTWPQEFVREYTDSISITLPSNYKTNLATRYYVNSVIGCQEEDFYYLRNGTGLRLQTLDGLQGDLGPRNSYGTSRPTAGAYASLDPGWGPDDTRAWIIDRSPYVQNCTTFGYAAVGQKIGGALHNGGNDSIVSNDFTQVISDGIGAWITNNGRAELVSVFTYYSHVGYLAENGGRIRGTNGNNSYGDFGSVAEGVDPEETAVTAVVDNDSQYRATVASVVTDQVDEILQIEYEHAGNDYTQVSISFFGPGDNEEVEEDEFRDDGINNVRILDSDDSTGSDQGGSGYTLVSNTAQAGTSSSITIAATDSNLSTAYPGMMLYIIGGSAVGQFGVIDTYDSGTKIATVVRESDGAAGWDHMIPGTTIVSPTSTSVYQIEPRVQFDAPPSVDSGHTLPAGNTWNDIKYFETTKLYEGVSSTTTSTTGSGATFDVEKVYTKYFITIDSAGTNYQRLDTITIPGTSVGGTTPENDIEITVTSINSTTGAVVEFDFTGEARGGMFIALSDTTAGAYSWDGETWLTNTMPSAGSGGTWHRTADGLVDDGSTSFRPSQLVAVTDQTNVVAYTTDGVTWTSGTLPVGMTAASTKYVAFAQLGAEGFTRHVVISNNDRDVAYSDDGGTTWLLTTNALPGTGYQHLTYGKGLFVAISDAGQSTYSEDGVTWLAGSGPSAETYTDMTYGKNKFIAVSSTNNAYAYSLDGKNWVDSTLPAIASPTAYTRVTYGQGLFVATQTSTGSTVVTSEDGIYWTQTNVTADPGTPSGHGAIGFGNPGRSGMFALSSNGGSKTHVVKLRKGCRARGRVSIASERIFQIRIVEPGSGYYNRVPFITITDPGNIYDANLLARKAKGVLAQPSFVNRGTGFTAATADIDQIGSNGSADFFQTGSYIAVRRLSKRPVEGSNVVFDSQPGTTYKLVNVLSFIGSNDGSYKAILQVSPDVDTTITLPDADPVTMRIRYSQVRLTGHDFLDIGTGNFSKTNYPGLPTVDPDPDNETVQSNGGRVFYTSTDQDGNFRVGDLFTIEQATGVATLNAEAFNIAGLQELTLGEVTLGGNSASITEFSTDPFFTANSDTVVPTQRAVKAYIESQIGGGGASLNVNSVTAGDIFIGGNSIYNVAGGVINITANINFVGDVTGIPIAYNYFLR